MNSDIDTIIENLVDLHNEPGGDSRQRHLFRESLRGLVRLAQAEQMWEIKSNVRMLTAMSQAELKRQANRLIKSTGTAKQDKEACQGKLALDSGKQCPDDAVRLRPAR